ncbi:lipopolysaccharide biosynthesis protein [Pararoseomonas indoligenes]|uniref:Polysaccharide biosynthesis C-terminal domain-containing protein n=1 Tax=Roseomonas indoligenes TaxID=2820811 RepID=A0A940SAI9_9PROT|nr:polysaccharide biosynthesis C-terminal domain-containing protein [Pararoseomonas indoligenes]MBP0496242.1 polysaccharide biosynthesis C-terminal domain-containing protein [Pararoseomonas indoligenes]
MTALPAIRPLLRGLLRGEGTGYGFAQTIVAQLVVVLFNVATGVLTARLLGPEGRGIFAAVTMWPQFLASVALAGLPFALTYHLRQDRDQAGGVLGASFLLALLLGILAILIGVLVMPATMRGRYSTEVILFCQVFSALTLANMLSMLAKQSFSALGRIRTFNLLSWADPGLYLVLLLAVAATATLTPERAAFCMGIQTVLVLAWSLLRLFRYCRPSLAGFRLWMPKILSYTARASGAGVLANLASYLDRLVLVALISPHDFGLYVVAFSLSRLLMVLQTGVGAVVLPAMIGTGEAAAKALHDRTLVAMLLAITVAIGGCFVLGKPLLVFLYGEEFAGAGLLMAILVIEASFSCLCQVTAQLFLALGRPSYVSVVQGIAFSVMAVGLLILAPAYGAIGAALAVTAGTALRFVLLLAAVPLHLRLPLRLAAAFRDLSTLVFPARPA